jgi:L,D-peptidoglycan transpeptidase YkuD (ErfK/YbiS/YcfS/YnhG family)
MRSTIGVVACLALCVAAAASGGSRPSAACADAPPVGLSTGSSTQLITVVARAASSTRATLQRWRRSGGCWRRVGRSATAWVGERGVSANRREGDRTTPAGVFGFGRVVYGVGPDPGVRYPYRRVVCGDWWVEDPRSPHYNRFRHVRCGTTPPFRVTTGDLAASPTAYRHFAVIAFNMDPVVPGRGSGIFLHASTGRPTVGCVSLPLRELVTVLRWLDPARRPLIAIGTRGQLARS